MGVLPWIIIGVAFGFMANACSPAAVREESGFLGVMLLGVMGAVIGGWIWSVAKSDTVPAGLDFTNIIAACAGSAVVIALIRVINRPTKSY